MASWSSAWTSSRRAWDCSCDFMPFLCSSSGGILSLIPSRNLRFVFRSQLKWSFVFNARLFTVGTTWTKGVSTTLLLHKPQSHPKSFPIKALHKHKRDLPTWCHSTKEFEKKKTCNIRKYINYSWYTRYVFWSWSVSNDISIRNKCHYLEQAPMSWKHFKVTAYRDVLTRTLQGGLFLSPWIFWVCVCVFAHLC